MVRSLRDTKATVPASGILQMAVSYWSTYANNYQCLPIEFEPGQVTWNTSESNYGTLIEFSMHLWRTIRKVGLPI